MGTVFPFLNVIEYFKLRPSIAKFSVTLVLHKQKEIGHEDYKKEKEKQPQKKRNGT